MGFDGPYDYVGGVTVRGASARERDAFVGREAELAVLREQWEAARTGHPRVVVIEGMPGMGKTSLLSRFLRELAGAGEGEVLRISADEDERELCLGLVDQLLRMAGREGIAPAATGARAANGAATTNGPATPATRARARDHVEAGLARDHVQAGLRVLATLDERQREAPLVVAVDDAHWADGASLHALLFAARRLVDSRVLLAIVACDSVPRALPDGLRKLAAEIRGATVTVAAFDVAELRTLAQRAGIALSPRAAERLWRYTQGSPLHAWSLLHEEHAADALPDTERRLAAPRRLAAEVAADLTRYSPDARALIEAVAVFGGAGCSLSGACDVAGVAEPLRALDEATQAGLLTAREQASGVRAIAFAHPLVAAAVYDGLGAARRSRLHAAIAAGSDDEGAALRHGVGAALGPDGTLAGRLEAFARDEAGRGAWESAASLFLSAGRVSERTGEREQRMLRALNATIIGGDVERARLLAADVETFADEPLRDAVLGHLALLDMRYCDAERLLARAWERVDAVADRALAALIAYRRAWQWLVLLDDARALEWSVRAIGLVSAGDPMRGPAHAVHALALGRSGRLGEAETALATMLEPASDASTRLTALRGWLRLVAEDTGGALSALNAASAAAERLGPLNLRTFALTQLARAQYVAGAWDDGAATSERAMALAREVEPSPGAFSWWSVVAIPAARGDWCTAQARIDACARGEPGYPERTADLALARAMLAAARGRGEAVLEALEPMLAIAPREAVAEPGVWPWQDLYADALVACGRLEDAGAFLPDHEALATERGRHGMGARLARASAGLASARGDAGGAEEAFARALAAIGRVEMPYDQALIELAFGAFLRRAGRRRAAAGQLQAAQTRLAGLGAAPALERCERELDACGLSPAKRGRSAQARDALTPQERAVARLVASGMSNREVAAELLLSVKTVGFHLTRIYAKLGIGSRSQLMAHAWAGGAGELQRNGSGATP